MMLTNNTLKQQVFQSIIFYIFDFTEITFNPCNHFSSILLRHIHQILVYMFTKETSTEKKNPIAIKKERKKLSREPWEYTHTVGKQGESLRTSY